MGLCSGKGRTGGTCPQAGAGAAAPCPPCCTMRWLWGTSQSRLVPSEGWGLRLAVGSPTGLLAVASGSQGFLCIPWLGRGRVKRGTKADARHGGVGACGRCWDTSPHSRSSPSPNCVPVGVPGGSGLALGLVCPAQRKGCPSLGVELVACPILDGPPAMGLTGLSWPSVAPPGSPADAVTEASVLPARPLVLCRRCAVRQYCCIAAPSSAVGWGSPAPQRSP